MSVPTSLIAPMLNPISPESKLHGLETWSVLLTPASPAPDTAPSTQRQLVEINIVCQGVGTAS